MALHDETAPVRSTEHCLRSRSVSKLVPLLFHPHDSDTRRAGNNRVLIRSGGCRKSADSMAWAQRAQLTIRASTLALCFRHRVAQKLAIVRAPHWAIPVGPI